MIAGKKFWKNLQIYKPWKNWKSNIRPKKCFDATKNSLTANMKVKADVLKV